MPNNKICMNEKQVIPISFGIHMCMGGGLYLPTCYLSSSCLLAHKAPTEHIHPPLSAAAILASAQDLHPLSSTVLGLLLFLLLSGVQERAMLQSSINLTNIASLSMYEK